MDNLKALFVAFLLVKNEQYQNQIYLLSGDNRVKEKLVMSYIEQIKADSDFMLMGLATRITLTRGAKVSLNELLNQFKTFIDHLDTTLLDGLIG